MAIYPDRHQLWELCEIIAIDDEDEDLYKVRFIEYESQIEIWTESIIELME